MLPTKLPAQLSINPPAQLSRSLPKQLCLCLLCRRCVTNIGTWKHEQTHREHRKPCLQCGRTFTGDFDRERHLTAEGPCQQASYTPKTRRWLSNAARRGLAEGMKWACTACDICFRDRLALQHHIDDGHPYHHRQKADGFVFYPSNHLLEPSTLLRTNGVPRPVYNATSTEENLRAASGNTLESVGDRLPSPVPSSSLPSSPSSHYEDPGDKDYSEDVVERWMDLSNMV